MKYSVAGLGLLAGLAACATGPQISAPGRPEQGGSPPERAQIFVSPYGELFLSRPSEAYPVAAWFAGADLDHDGRLTAQEFAVDGVRWFDKLDLDRDGVVGPAEIAAYERSVDVAFAGLGGMEPGGARGPGGGRDTPPGGGQANLNGDDAVQDGPMGGQGPGGGQDGGQRPRQQPYRGGTERLARAGLLSVPQPVRAADRNGDQKITHEEWRVAGERWFALLDQDHDGVLTLESLPKTAIQAGPGEGGRPPRR